MINSNKRKLDSVSTLWGTDQLRSILKIARTEFARRVERGSPGGGE